MRESIKTAFLGSVAVLSVALLGLLTVISVYMQSEQMESDVQELLEAQGAAIAEKFNEELTRVGGKTDALAMSLSSMNGNYDLNSAYRLIDHLVTSDDMVFGSGIWFAPNKYPGGSKWFGPYFSKGDNGKISLTMEYSTEEYNYPQFAWYKEAIKGDKEVFWDEPAYDPVSNTTMMSSSSPIRIGNQVVGVVTVDIGMQKLEDYIKGLKIGEHGYAFLLTQSGFYAASPHDEKNMQEKITDSSTPELKELGNKIMGLTEPEHFNTAVFGEDSYVAAVPVAATGLKLVLAAPERDYSGPIHRTMIANIVIALLVVLMLTAAIYVIFNRRIDRPIKALLTDAEGIAAGNLTLKAELASDDELGQLGGAINKMAEDIRAVMQKISRMSEKLSAASQELSSTAEQSLTNMNSMASSVGEMAEGVKQQESHIVDTAS